MAVGFIIVCILQMEWTPLKDCAACRLELCIRKENEVVLRVGLANEWKKIALFCVSILGLGVHLKAEWSQESCWKHSHWLICSCFKHFRGPLISGSKKQ